MRVDLNWLKELIKVGEENRRAGILGCKILDFEGKKIQNIEFSILPNGKSIEIDFYLILLYAFCSISVYFFKMSFIDTAFSKDGFFL